MCEHARENPAVGVARQDVRRIDALAGEQRPKVGDLLARVLHARRRDAVAGAHTVIGADLGAVAKLGLHGLPLRRVGAETGLQHDGRFA